MKTLVRGGKLIRIFALCGAIAWAGAAGAESLQLVPGSSQKVSVPGGVKKITVANPSVADASPGEDGKSVTVSAVGNGSTDIRIEQQTGNEIVVNIKTIADLKAVSDEIKELLSGVEGLTVKPIATKIVLDGKLATKSDFDRVAQISEAYSGLILNLSKLDRAELNEFVAKAIKADLGIETINVKVSGDTATLEGIVFDDADLKKAEQVAKLRVPNVINLLKVEEVMIETDVYFLQVTSADSKDFGFNILKTLAIDGSASVSGSSGEEGVASWSVGGSIAAKINALVGSGNGKILAQPHISTKSGGTGRFHSGGQTFFKVSGVNSGSLQPVEFGVILNVKPVLRGKDSIMNEVGIEVSVPSAQPSGDFSLDKFDTTSTTLCKEGDSIIISGLAQSLQTYFKEKTPLLGSIPLLNLFFSESSKKMDNKELVVVLIPHAVLPQAAKQGALSDDGKKLFEHKDEQLKSR